MQVNWKGFKSGTDVRGIGCIHTDDPLYLSDDVVSRIAKAFAVWLRARCGKDALTVSVGHDSRVSSERIDAAVTDALTQMGARVVSCGMASTPAMFMTTVTLPCDGAVQITASHHPMDKNGLKFFTPDGGLEGGDILELLTLAEANAFTPAAARGTAERVDFMATYAEMLRRQIRDGIGNGDQPLTGFKIAVDAGNGVGGFYARDVLAPLGADVSGSRFLEPDGTFPNHPANPEDKRAMAMASAATVESGADLGIVFDTDVDRAGCVDANGSEINRNRLVALASAIALETLQGGLIWIADANDQSADYSRLVPPALRKVRMLLVVGAAEDRMSHTFKGIIPTIVRCASLAEALQHAYRYQSDDEVRVVYSPACYNGFSTKQQGETFRREVNEL